MNKKNWLYAVATAVGVLALGAAGYSLGKPAIKTAAVDADDGHTWGIIGTFPGNNWESDYVKSGAYDAATGTRKLVVSMTAGTGFKIRADNAYVVALGSDVLTQSRTGGADYFEAYGTEGNAKVKTGYDGQFTFTINGGEYSYGDKSYGITVAFAAQTTYAITEYKVVDGVKDATAIATETAFSGTAFTPVDQHITGTKFDGWFTDELCTSAYTATTWSAAGSLYAKYTTLSTYRYMYFQLQGWSNVYIYTFGQSEAMGAFPGTKVVSGTNGQYDTVATNFQSNGGIAKCAYLTGSGDNKVIFSDGTAANQTADLTIMEDAYYTIAGTIGDDVLGLAAGWICQAEAALEAATNSSSCTISKTDATTLWNAYNGITNTTAKAAINSATVFTWKDINRVETEKANVSYEAIANRLYALSTASSGVYSPFMNPESKESSWVLFASIAVAAMTGAVIFYTLRKRKHE